MTWKLYY